MSKVLYEITPLSEKDCIYIVERYKSEFLFPIHTHKEFELNFVENGKGVLRVVGDSIEEIGDYDLTLVCGSNLEHAWEQGNCTGSDVREITIQFDPDLFPSNLLNKNQFSAISKLLRKAERGVSFSRRAVMLVYEKLNSLPKEQHRFTQYLNFLWIMNTLAEDADSRILSSGSFAKVSRDTGSRRIYKVKQYIGGHYSEDIRLETLSELVGMTPSAFSRFFRQQTGRTVMEYIIDIRLGNAARLLVDTTDGIAEICYACGFNNLSNFNRLFKAKRGYTPRDFRALFKKNRVFV